MIEGTAIFIVNSQGEFLAGERINTVHLPGYIGLPGGKVDPGESRLDCIVREVREETGLEIDKSLVHELGEAIPYVEHDIICQWFYVVFEFPDEVAVPDNKVKSWKRYSLRDLPDNLMPGTEEMADKLRLFLAANSTHVPFVNSLRCPGCGQNQIHKMCPAHGTAVYMNPDHPDWGKTK